MLLHEMQSWRAVVSAVRGMLMRIRSLAIVMVALCILLGNAPSPVVAGAANDKDAPKCNVDIERKGTEVKVCDDKASAGGTISGDHAERMFRFDDVTPETPVGGRGAALPTLEHNIRDQFKRWF
jgi:hypothetical protein